MAYNKILYSRFGFDIKLLDMSDGTNIFKLLAKAKLDRTDRNPEMYSHDRRILKEEIRFSLEKDNYNSVGIFNCDKLIGISFSSFIYEENEPWLGYFYIEPEYRKTKASVVLINYLVNHLYKGYRMQMGDTDITHYGKLIQHIPVVEYSVFKKGVAERFARICDSGSGEEKAA